MTRTITNYQYASHSSYFLGYSPLIEKLPAFEHMALLKYFKLNKPSLPDPEGPLSAHVSSDCIREANKEVSVALKVKHVSKVCSYKCVFFSIKGLVR